MARGPSRRGGGSSRKQNERSDGPMTQEKVDKMFGKLGTRIPLPEETSAPANKHQTSAAELISCEGSSAFRQRLALCLVTNRRMKIENFRTSDSVMPGVRPSEACIIELAQKLSENSDIRIGGGHAYSEVTVNDSGILVGCENACTIECPPDRGLSYYLEFLMMIGPFTKHGLNGLTLRGVTDHPLDLSIDSFRAGMTGAWRQLGGKSTEGPVKEISEIGTLPNVDVIINSRGLLPDGGGSVTLHCGIFNKKQSCLKPLTLVYPGRICRIRGVAYTCHMNPMHATRTMESARGVLNNLLADVHIYTEIAKGDKAGKSAGFGVSLVAESLEGCFYTADGVIDKHHDVPADGSRVTPVTLLRGNTRDVNYAPRPNLEGPSDALQSEFLGKRSLEELLDRESNPTDAAQKQEPMSAVLGREVALKLVAEVAEAGVLGSGFQWLGLYYMALADDTARSKLLLGRLTPHSVMLLRTIKEFIGVEFDVQTYTSALAAARLQDEDTASASPDSAAPHSVPAPATDYSELTSLGKQLKASLQTNRFIVSCRGVGYSNISRVTF